MSSLALAGIASIPLVLLGAAYGITEAIRTHNERRMLHAIFDGDRMQFSTAHGKRWGGYTFEEYEQERRYY